MSFIDWSLGTQPETTAQQQQGNAATIANIRSLQARNALRGINVGDQTSVQRGINALTGLGMIDQAKAVTDLAQTRAQNTATLPLLQKTAALYGQGLDRMGQPSAQQDQGSPTSDDQSDLTPDQLQHAQATMQAAGQALARVKAAPPEQRAAILDQELGQFEVAGLDPRAIANVRSHLTDTNFADESIDDLTNHYASHAENFGNVAQGGAPNANPSRHAADVFGPGTDLATATVTDPMLMDPRMRGFAAKYLGVDTGPGIDTAVNLTANQRSVAAAGPQAYATTAATNIANFNTEPAVTRAVAKAQAQGTQAGTTQQVQMDDGSTKYGVFDRRADGTPYMIPLEGGGPSAGATSGPQPGTPGIAKAAGIGGTAKSAIDAATAFENYSNGYVARKANIENLRQAASDISTGPLSKFWGGLGRLAAEYSISTPFNPTANQAAAYEEVQKMAASVLSQQKEALGLPNTNQSVTLSAGVTPHEETSPLGLKRLAGVLEGNEDYINATRQAWETWKSQNHTAETYNQWLPGWMKLFDPRVFQAQYMDDQQRARVKASVGKRFDAEEAAAKRLGYLGGN